MTILTSARERQDELSEQAEALLDELERQGYVKPSSQVMALLSSVGLSAHLAERAAERALAEGDAAQALEFLIPAWEAGAEVGPVLALACVAGGLDDAALGLMTAEETALELATLRLILAVGRGETFELDRSVCPPSELVWRLTAQLRTLERCGRFDVIHRFQEVAPALELPGLVAAVARLKGRPAPSRAPASPPLGYRERFVEALGLAGADALFNWGWSLGREVGEGESVLVLGDAGQALKPLLAHGETVMLSQRGDGDGRCEPSALPLASGRFDHVVLFFWLDQTHLALEALNEARRVLKLGGTLHLLCAGPMADSGMGWPSSALLEWSRAAGLEVKRWRARDERGADTPPRRATWFELRAGKRLRSEKV